MSVTMGDNIKRWTVTRKTALMIGIIQGKTTVAEASRSFDLPPSETEGWAEDAKRGMENSLRAKTLQTEPGKEQKCQRATEGHWWWVGAPRISTNCAGREACTSISEKKSSLIGLIAEAGEVLPASWTPGYASTARATNSMELRWFCCAPAWTERGVSFGAKTFPPPFAGEAFVTMAAAIRPART